MDGKEFSNRLAGVSKLKVEIGKSKDPILARRQEKQIIEFLSDSFADYRIIGIEQFFAENGLKHETQNEKNKEESKYGDLVFLDNSGNLVCFLEIKVGTKPPPGKGPYYGACSITSLCNKLKQMKTDKILRILLAIDSDGDFRICNPHKMLKWLLNDENAFLIPTKDKSKAKWENEYTKALSGKVRVGYCNSAASKNNPVHGADYFPSFPFKQNLFRF